MRQIIFCHFGRFLGPLTPPNDPENKKFEKMKKKFLEILPLYTCQPYIKII